MSEEGGHPTIPRNIPPFVSADWLERHLNDPELIIVDIRHNADYGEGHVPGALNSFFGEWIVERNGLMLELPDSKALLRLIGSLGIVADSSVVVVSLSDNSYSRADAVRVGFTMIAAGLTHVAVLDGGYARWLIDGKPVSNETVVPQPRAYKGKVNRSVIASRAHVKSRIGKAIILDNREPKVYYGLAIEPFAPKPGHIKSAINLPIPWFYTEDGTLLERNDIEAMVANAAGKDKSKEIIVYCGVGGYGSAAWFLLTQMLGYRNVRLYDGAAQDWVRDPKAPMTKYSWH